MSFNVSMRRILVLIEGLTHLFCSLSIPLIVLKVHEFQCLFVGIFVVIRVLLQVFFLVLLWIFFLILLSASSTLLGFILLSLFIVVLNVFLFSLRHHLAQVSLLVALYSNLRYIWMLNWAWLNLLILWWLAPIFNITKLIFVAEPLHNIWAIAACYIHASSPLSIQSPSPATKRRAFCSSSFYLIFRI